MVTLRRPPHNLLTEPVLRALADAIHGLRGVARAAVVCSEGRSFCAGADFRSGDAPDPTDQSDFETRTGAFYEQAVRVFESPVPLVAAVQGAAIGAGLGLALACDLCIVGELGWFQANFVRLGIHPGFALSTTLPARGGAWTSCGNVAHGPTGGCRRGGENRHGEQRVVPDGDEVDVALEMAQQIATGAPLAVSATRTTLRHGLADAAREAMRHELAEQAALAGTADAVEGVRAMLEGRDPAFEGR